ncbi:hypothetical protein B0T17DRAFT_520541 [Bombardia bombarda]|uniref:Uncharacterized protein n=1 Tax=Bombardia bombarda TaxID=252184 RepID=A0AA39XPJ9_9PEZI|nr:hypothetical protein B0T17DRAFT_520541 [Bombardia bombarda]
MRYASSLLIRFLEVPHSRVWQQGLATMASNTTSVPVILCGKAVEIGSKVAPAIKPEMEVVHFINSLQDAKDNIPELLAGRGPLRPSGNEVGTHDYTKPPRAVIFGRAFTPEDVIELNRLCRGKGAAGPIAWIAGDPGYKPPANPGPAYAAKAADNVKNALKKWQEEGANSEEIVYY